MPDLKEGALSTTAPAPSLTWPTSVMPLGPISSTAAKLRPPQRPSAIVEIRLGFSARISTYLLGRSSIRRDTTLSRRYSDQIALERRYSSPHAISGW